MSKIIRLITLNAWCGRSLYPLIRFLQKESERTDIFCLQEIRNSDQEIIDARYPDEYIYGPLFSIISRELKGFKGHLASFEDDPHRMSVAMFVRNTLRVNAIKEYLVYAPKNPQETGKKIFSARKLQYAVLEIRSQKFVVANYHGLWNAGPKTDTPERLNQSMAIRLVLDDIPEPKILCGDFNLLPETYSMRILEQGMRNMVKEYGIQSTRTVLYRSYDDPSEPNFADYILTSPDVVVKNFEVLPDIVSDHSPLYLEFEV